MPKKSLGQNFLHNNDILNNIVESGCVLNNDTILEIGPGTGNLTEKIIKKNPKKIIVVEKDKSLANLLKKKFNSKIEIINKDILDCYNKVNFDIPIKVFGNLPYNISTKILTSFIKIENFKNRFKKFIFVFQKEVADRILAEENTKYFGRLSILTSWKTNKFKVMDIDPKYFFPKPKVWSSLIVLKPKLKVEEFKNPKNLEHLTTIFFNQRRKMIKKPMRQLFKNYEKIANDLNLDLNLRPQNISNKKYLELCKLYENLIK